MTSQEFLENMDLLQNLFSPMHKGEGDRIMRKNKEPDSIKEVEQSLRDQGYVTKVYGNGTVTYNPNSPKGKAIQKFLEEECKGIESGEKG